MATLQWGSWKDLKSDIQRSVEIRRSRSPIARGGLSVQLQSSSAADLDSLSSHILAKLAQLSVHTLRISNLSSSHWFPYMYQYIKLQIVKYIKYKMQNTLYNQKKLEHSRYSRKFSLNFLLLFFYGAIFLLHFAKSLGGRPRVCSRRRGDRSRSHTLFPS